MQQSESVYPLGRFVNLRCYRAPRATFSSPKLTYRLARQAAYYLAGRGETFLATMITSPPVIYERNLPILGQLCADLPEIVLGIHLEGPWVSADERVLGIHSPAWIRTPRPNDFDLFNGWSGGHLRMVTLAAEIRGAAKLTRHIRENSPRVAVALGHQTAGPAKIDELVDAGATATIYDPADLSSGLAKGLIHALCSNLILMIPGDVPQEHLQIALWAKSAGKTCITGTSSGHLGRLASTMLGCLNRLASLKFRPDLDFSQLKMLGQTAQQLVLRLGQDTLDQNLDGSRVEFDNDTRTFFIAQ